MSIRLIAKKVLFGLMVVGLFFFCLGVSMSMGTWLYLKNFIQGEVVIVPDLLGLTIEEARNRIERLDLVFHIDDGQRVYSDVIKKDRVYLQSPRPNRKIKSGRVIEVTISAGPEEKRIPHLRGETLNFSETLLSEVGKKPEIIARAPSSVFARGRVLDQNPKGGESPDLERPIALLISDGPDERWRLMPDLRGKDYAVVKAFLDRHEFRTLTKYDAEDETLGPVVLRQIPLPGFPVNKSQTITLIVNKDY